MIPVRSRAEARVGRGNALQPTEGSVSTFVQPYERKYFCAKPKSPVVLGTYGIWYGRILRLFALYFWLQRSGRAVWSVCHRVWEHAAHHRITCCLSQTKQASKPDTELESTNTRHSVYLAVDLNHQMLHNVFFLVSSGLRPKLSHKTIVGL